MMDMFEVRPLPHKVLPASYEQVPEAGKRVLMPDRQGYLEAVNNLLCLYHNIPADGRLAVTSGAWTACWNLH